MVRQVVDDLLQNMRTIGRAARDFVDELFLNLRPADFADVLVVTVLFYLGLLWLRQRAARAVAFALFLLALLYVGANVFNMYLTRDVFRYGVPILLVALVVIFQQDIRRTFEQLSSWRGFISGRGSQNWSVVINHLVETTSTLSRQKIGALMVLEGAQPLEPHIEGGVSVKGRISMSLLMSIFHPATPGHDGAVVIDRDRFEMFGVYLPLSRNLDKVGRGGTRHAAALGLSECSDALVIVVSEERGTISLAEKGDLTELASVAALKNRLDSFYTGKYPTGHEKNSGRTWRRRLTLQALSLGLACLLWFFAAYRDRIEILQRSFEEVPIEFRNPPKGLVIDDPKPSKTRVTLTGSVRDFSAFDPKNLKISIDLQGFREGPMDLPLEGKHLNLPSGLAVRHFETPSVKFNLYYRDLSLELPVKLNFEDKQLPKEFVIEKTESAPKKIALMLRDVGQAPPKEIETEMISLKEERPPTAVFLPMLKLPPNTEFVGGKQPEVKVTFHIGKKKESPEINGNPP